MRRGTRLDATTLLLVAGVGWLAWTVCAPYAIGQRLAAVEAQARTATRVLFDLAADPAWPEAEASAHQALAERLAPACAAAGIPKEAWPRPVAEPAPGGILLRSDAYLFLLARTPPAPSAPVVRAQPEVWAWPASDATASSAAFCRTADGIMATRNIAGTYRGPERIPEPGTWRRRDPGDGGAYRGLDGSYWRSEPE